MKKVNKRTYELNCICLADLFPRDNRRLQLDVEVIDHKNEYIKEFGEKFRSSYTADNNRVYMTLYQCEKL